jgi:hypothetical protein
MYMRASHDRLCGLVVRIPEVPGSIPALPDFLSSSGYGTGFHLAFVRINEELLERKSSGSGLEN